MKQLSEYYGTISARQREQRISSILNRRRPVGAEDQEQYMYTQFDPDNPFPDSDEQDMDANPFSPLDDEDALSGREVQVTVGGCGSGMMDPDEDMDMDNPEFGMGPDDSGMSMDSMGQDPMTDLTTGYNDAMDTTDPSTMDSAERLRSVLMQARPEEQEEDMDEFGLDDTDDVDGTDPEDELDEPKTHEEPDGDEKTVTINLNINVNPNGKVNVTTGDEDKEDENIYDLGLEDFGDEETDIGEDGGELEGEVGEDDDDLGLEGDMDDMEGMEGSEGLEGEDQLGLEGEGEDEFGEEEDPNRQGAVRLVPGAHLVFKRQQEDGTFSEMWIYNMGEEGDKSASKVRKSILAGTDIPQEEIESEDGAQTYNIWTAGNAQVLRIEGLPN